MQTEGLKKGFGELFHLQLCSPKPQTWHSHFFLLVKGFKSLAIFFPSLKRWVIVQSEFEFKIPPLFSCSKIGQTNFRKWRIFQAFQNTFSYVFLPCELLRRIHGVFCLFLNRKIPLFF